PAPYSLAARLPYPACGDMATLRANLTGTSWETPESDAELRALGVRCVSEGPTGSTPDTKPSPPCRRGGPAPTPYMSGLATSPLAMAPMDLIVPTDRGLYCPAGDFHVDPWRPVGRALITHAHSDHARPGSDLYVCHRDTAPILRRRLGDVAIETVDYGAKLARDGVEVSFHPAGHVLGSAQIRMAHRGEVWVAAGDYKLENDGVATAFEPQRCNVFITESTFGLPIYHWRAQAENYAAIDAWWRDNAAAGRASVLYAYALGKAQRVIAHVDASIGPIVCHGAVEPINALTRQAGIAL